MTNKILSEKIVRYYGYFEENSLKSIAKTCAKLIINEYFNEICSGYFNIPTLEEVKEWVLDEINQDFDEKIMEAIDNTYPDMSDEEINTEIARLEKIYVKEHEEQLTATSKAAIKELHNRVKALQKEIEVLKKKYTS